MEQPEEERKMTSTNTISRWLNTIDEHIEKSCNSFPEEVEEEYSANTSNGGGTTIRLKATAAAVRITSDNDYTNRSTAQKQHSQIQLCEDNNDDNNQEEATSIDSWSSDYENDDDEQDASIPIVLHAGYPTWGGNETANDMTPPTNCHGIVHVRLIKALRLPNLLTTTTTAAAASSITHDVQAILALPPWKGRIKSPKTKTHTTARGLIQIHWDNQEEQHTTSSYSMVHNFNNQDTPIPHVIIDLVSLSNTNLAAAAATLLLGTTSTTTSTNIFENYLCSFTISCVPIMQRPGQYLRRWFAATTYEEEANNNILQKETTTTHLDFYSNKEPLILLELCFEPSCRFSQNILPASTATIDNTDYHTLQKPEGEEEKEEQEQDNATTNTTLSHYTQFSSVTSINAHHHYHHLFRIKTFWIPAYCAVCASLFIRRKAHRCEVCKLDCCADCLISVDVLYPCGSQAAKVAVKQSLQTKLEFRNIMEAVAPTATSEHEQKLPVQPNSVENDYQNQPIIQQQKQGIGTLKIRIHRATLFEKLYPPEAFLEDIVDNSNTNNVTDDGSSNGKDTITISTFDKGDHYVRISWNHGKESVRTRTIYQTSNPVFDGEEIQLLVPNYGTEYKIEVVDANNDTLVGCSLLSTQMMLLWQYDKFLSPTATNNENNNGSLLKGLVVARTAKVESTRRRLELRTSVKSGYGLDFYNSSATKSRNSDGNKSKRVMNNNIDNRPGAISGFIDLDVAMEEDLDSLMYSLSSRVSQSRPPEDLNIELIQLHLARIGNLLEDTKVFASHLAYVVSWNNPALTGLCMIIFVFACFRFNADYIGSIPFGSLLIYMLYQYEVRRKGNSKMFWINKEREARIEAEKKLAASACVHRPIAHLRLIVERGKNIRSRELGLPGCLTASVTWIPYRNLSPRENDRLKNYEAVTPFHVGITTNSGVTTNPIWRGIIPSDEVVRLQHLICNSKTNIVAEGKSHANQSTLSLDQAWDESSSFFLPILQPVTLSGSNINGCSSPQSGLRLLPWKSSSGAILIQVRTGVLNKLLVFEDLLGEVEIPFSDFFDAKTNKNGEKIINNWFPLKMIRGDESINGLDALKDSQFPSVTKMHDDKPEIFVKARLCLPRTSSPLNDSDREMSSVVAEGMIRSSVLSSGNKSGVLGSSVHTINTVGGLIGNVQMIQNLMGRVLDMVESAINALTWVHPHRSFVIFIVVLVAFLVLSIIPSRLLIFCGGIAPFIVNFIAIFLGDGKETSKGGSEPVSSPLGALVINFFNALPTHEDLRRAYFWEGRRIGERERQQLAKSKRVGRLTRLWNALWYGTLKIKKQSSGRSWSDRNWTWETVFVLVQGHRIVWWTDERQFDEAESPIGFILLSGHAGLGGLSPMDIRELHGDEAERIVCIFGRGKIGQQKVCFLANDCIEKNGFHDAIVQAAEDDKMH